MICSSLSDTTITYNDWCLGQAKRRTLFQTSTLFLCSQITHCIEHYRKKGLYLRAFHLIFYKPCLSPLKWGRKAWQRHLWKAAGPNESFTYFSGKKVLSWTAVDGGIDDPEIKTLVEELRDLDSIGQIFCLALGRLLWFVMPLFSHWKMGMAGLICLAGVQGDRWCRVLGYKIEKWKNSQKSKAAAFAPEGFWESKIELTLWSSSTTREAGRPQAGISAEPWQWAYLFLASTPGGQYQAEGWAQLRCRVCTSATGLAVSRSRTGSEPEGVSMTCGWGAVWQADSCQDPEPHSLPACISKRFGFAVSPNRNIQILHGGALAFLHRSSRSWSALRYIISTL